MMVQLLLLVIKIITQSLVALRQARVMEEYLFTNI